MKSFINKFQENKFEFIELSAVFFFIFFFALFSCQRWINEEFREKEKKKQIIDRINFTFFKWNENRNRTYATHIHTTEMRKWNEKLNYRLTSWFIRIWWFLYAIKANLEKKTRKTLTMRARYDANTQRMEFSETNGHNWKQIEKSSS